MTKFKLAVDKAGNFYTKAVFKLVPPDLIGRGADNSKVSLKLSQPKNAHITPLTLTINKKTINVPKVSGDSVTAGPFPMLVGENQISFEGRSDNHTESHEIEMIPLLLK